MTSTIINIAISLVALQIFMGLLDTLLHHEFRERLAWRENAATELRLHALRNIIYAVLFITFAWWMPKGVFAAIAIGLIALEVLITLWDFVEEDMTRKLPASERVLHTLLTLNYGAILLAVLPSLTALAVMPNNMEPVNHGVISAFLCLAALGVVIFAARDFFAARRIRHFQHHDASALGSALRGHKHILVTGATGFIGTRLCAALIGAGYSLTILTRNPIKAAETLPTPVKIIGDLNDIRDEAAVDAVINLAGEPLANGLWTRAKREKILYSRTQMLQDLHKLCERLYVPPKTIITASAIGWYGLRGEETLTETSQPAACFTHQVCAALESEAEKLTRFDCRVVQLRLGLVLGLEGGMLANLLVPFEWGLGGPIGNGEQWMSWIERDDAIRLIIHCLLTPELSGPVNAVAPQPVRGKTFAKNLGVALHRPAILPVSARLLEATLGDFARELLLASQRVMPEKAVNSGFEFQSPDLESALAYILPMKQIEESSGQPAHKHII